jgi:hypothetical protein
LHNWFPGEKPQRASSNKLVMLFSRQNILFMNKTIHSNKRNRWKWQMQLHQRSKRQTNERTYERTVDKINHKRTKGQTNKRTNEKTNKRTNERTYERTVDKIIHKRKDEKQECTGRKKILMNKKLSVVKSSFLLNYVSI